MTTPDNPGQDALRPADPPLLIGFDEATTIDLVPLPDPTAPYSVIGLHRPSGAHPDGEALDGPSAAVLRTSTKAELYREVGR